MISIVIAGLGPRGLTILERIIAHERIQKTTDMEISIFEPGEPGVGCHQTDQPDHLLVNTVAGQMTMFSDFTVKDAGPILDGPSFYQWLDSCDTGSEISPDKYYPRRDFGRYLNYVYQYILDHAPDHVSIRLFQQSLQSASRAASGCWEVVGQSGVRHYANFLFITTGHGICDTESYHTSNEATNSKLTSVVDLPYPVHQKLHFVKPGWHVGIEGMGLTFFDVLSEFTIGRGGRFVRDQGKLVYFPSGKEPVIAAYSRSGLPLTARASNQKGVEGQYHARFLVYEHVARLRKQGKIDFERDILPLLTADMEFAYYSAYISERDGCVQAMRFRNAFVASDTAGRERLVRDSVPKSDWFSWNKLVSPVPPDALQNSSTYRNWLIDYLESDVEEARRGNICSPVKAASDVLRDVRDIVRAAIDFAGLTEESHRWLFSTFVPAMNRIAVGPPKERIEEMLSLIHAGVLNVGFGPGAFSSKSSDGRVSVHSKFWTDVVQDVNVLVSARISMPHIGECSSGLIGSLLAAGYCRPFLNDSFNPGGLEVDQSFNIISRSGDVIDNAWALGVPTEGVKFYTFVVPRPGVNSTALVDAGRAVRSMLLKIRKYEQGGGT